jgi:mediator of RNA polymerase II transcription subunit 13
VPSDGASSPEEAQKMFSPSIYLSRPPPKSIEFKLTTEPSPALLLENSVLHIAYSQSLDERWVSVAWTDNWGMIQSTELYSLGRKNTTILRPFDEVCRDIWNKTIEITSTRKVHWRLILVKVGEPLQDEISTWTTLASTTTHSLAILSADLNPPVYLIPSLPAPIPTAFNHQVSVYTTPPVTTPTPGSIVSPDQFGNAANTPSADPTPDLDPDSYLVDVCDETWGVVLPHIRRLPPDYTRGALAYLIKRGGINDGDELRALKIELIIAENRGGAVPLLKEVLGWYRDLACLALWKGVVGDGRGSGAPWHLAVAWKGVEGVGWVM